MEGPGGGYNCNHPPLSVILGGCSCNRAGFACNHPKPELTYKGYVAGLILTLAVNYGVGFLA